MGPNYYICADVKDASSMVIFGTLFRGVLVLSGHMETRIHDERQN